MQTLLGKTQAYWSLSLSYCGYGKPVTTHDALATINKLTTSLNPDRPLACRVRQIGEEIITGKSHKNVVPAKVFRVHTPKTTPLQITDVPIALTAANR